MLDRPRHGLSVVIPIWNIHTGLETVTRVNTRYLHEHTHNPLDIIIIDNGSPNPLDADFINRYHIQYIRWPSNRGIAPAWNEGARLARYPTICFLNNDCYVEPGWDVSLGECARGGPHVAFPYTNDVKSDGIGITGWCFAASVGSIRDIGGFDETFVPAFYEDTDWFHRAHHKGYTLYSVPQSRVRHDRRTTARNLNQMNLLFQANMLRFYWKHNLNPQDAPPIWRHPLPDWAPPQEG